MALEKNSNTPNSVDTTSTDRNLQKQQVEAAQATKDTQSQLQGAETGVAATQAKEKIQKTLPFESANTLPGTKHSFEYIKNTSLSKDIASATEKMDDYKGLSSEQRVEKFSDNIDKVWFLALDTIIDNPAISQESLRDMATGNSIAFMKWYNGAEPNTKKTVDDFLKYGIGNASSDISDKKNFLSGFGGIFTNLFRGFGANTQFKQFMDKNMKVASAVNRFGDAGFLKNPAKYSDMVYGAISQNFSSDQELQDYIEKNFYDKKFTDSDLAAYSDSQAGDIKKIMETTGNSMTPEMLQRLNGLGKYFQVVESGKNTIKNAVANSPILDGLIGSLYNISSGKELSGPLAWLSNTSFGQEIMNTLKPVAGVAMPLMNYVCKFLGFAPNIPAGTSLADWQKTHPYGSVESFLEARNQVYLLDASSRDRIAQGLTGLMTGADSALRTGTIFSDPSKISGSFNGDFVQVLNKKMNVDFSKSDDYTKAALSFFSDNGPWSQISKSINENYYKTGENYDLGKISKLVNMYYNEWDKSKTFEEYIKSKQQAVDPQATSDDPDAKKPSDRDPYSLDGVDEDENSATQVAQKNAAQDDSDSNGLTSGGVEADTNNGVVGETLTLAGANYISNAKNFLSKPNAIVKNMRGNDFISSQNQSCGIYEQCTRYAAYRMGYRTAMGNGNMVATNLLKTGQFENVSNKWDKVGPGSIISGTFDGVVHVCVVEQVDLKNKKVLTTGMNEGINSFDKNTCRSDMAGVVRVQWRSFDSLKNMTIAKPKDTSSYMKTFVSTGQDLGLLTKTNSSATDGVQLPTSVDKGEDFGNLKYKYEGLDFEKPQKFKDYLNKINTDPLVNKIYNTWAKKYGTNVAKRAVIVAGGESQFDPTVKAGGSEDSWGLFQINLGAHAQEVANMSGIGSSNKPALRTWLKNPDNNIKFAMQLYKSKGNFSDWTAASKSRHVIGGGYAGNGVMDIFNA